MANEDPFLGNCPFQVSIGKAKVKDTMLVGIYPITIKEPIFILISRIAVSFSAVDCLVLQEFASFFEQLNATLPVARISK